MRQRAILGHFRELGLLFFLDAQLLAHHVLGSDGGRGRASSRMDEKNPRRPVSNSAGSERRTDRGSFVVSFTDTSLPQVSSSSAAVSRTS